MSICKICDAAPCTCMAKWSVPPVAELGPNGIIMAAPTLPQLYAERAAIAATMTGNTSRDHPPAYVAIDAQIQAAVAALGGNLWQGKNPWWREGQAPPP